MSLILFHLRSWHEPRRVGEQVVHLLKRELLRLRKEGPEEYGVGEVANLKVKDQLPVIMQER
jgi:hypothetical protein